MCVVVNPTGGVVGTGATGNGFSTKYGVRDGVLAATLAGLHERERWCFLAFLALLLFLCFFLLDSCFVFFLAFLCLRLRSSKSLSSLLLLPLLLLSPSSGAGLFDALIATAPGSASCCCARHSAVRSGGFQEVVNAGPQLRVCGCAT